MTEFRAPTEEEIQQFRAPSPTSQAKAPKPARWGDEPPKSGGSYMADIGSGLLHSAADLGTGFVDFMGSPTPEGQQPLPTPSNLIKQIPGYSRLQAYADAPSKGMTEKITREAGDIIAPAALPLGEAKTVLQATPAAIDWALKRYGPYAAKLAWKNVPSALDYIAQRASPKALKYAEGILGTGAKTAAPTQAGKMMVGGGKGAIGAGVQPGKSDDTLPATAAGGGAGALYGAVPGHWRLPALALLAAAEAARMGGERSGYVSPFLAYETGSAATAPLALLGSGGIGALAGQLANWYQGQGNGQNR
jgi:hypothetical protein